MAGLLTNTGSAHGAGRKGKSARQALAAKRAASLARQSSSPRDWRLFLPPVLLVFSLLVAYANAFHVPFLLDDPGAITENPAIQRLWSWRIFLPPADSTVSGRPLLNASFAVNYALGGINPWGYHLVNVLIHILSAFVLWAVVRRALAGMEAAGGAASKAASGVAWCTAFVWALHPLQTESVTYVVQRAESLAGLFYLLTLYLSAKGADSSRPAPWHAGAVACCLLGAATKEVLATAPVVVLLYDRSFVAGSFGEALRKRRALYAALTLTWLVLLPLALAGRGQSAGFGVSGATPLSYLFTQCGVVLHYLRLVVLPWPLVFDYFWPIAGSAREVLLPAAAMLVLLGAVLWALWRRPGVGFAGAAFFLLLAPSSSIVPVVTEVAAEHRMYLALAPVLVLLLVAARTLAARLAPANEAKLLAGAACCVAVVCGGLTWKQNRLYESGFSIWSSVLEHRPNNPRARYNLAMVFESEGQLEEAIEQYRKCVAIAPDYLDARCNLGLALMNAGQMEQAEKAFRDALAKWPASAQLHNNMGLFYSRTKRLEEAKKEYGEALRLSPDYGEAHYNRANVLIEDKDVSGAIGELEEAVRLRPGMAPAHMNLANLLANNGQPEKALVHYREALRIRPAHAAGHFNLAILLLKGGQRDQARAELETTLALDPNFAPARQALESLK